MSKRLSKKEKVFVERKADGATGVAAVLNNYQTTDVNVAAAIASENLTKPKIVEALKELGFDSNNAKRVIGEILNDQYAEHKDRLKAGELVLKTNGDMAPEKHLVVTRKLISTDE